MREAEYVTLAVRAGMISINEARGRMALPAVPRIVTRGGTIACDDTVSCSYCRATVHAGRDRCQVCGAPR